MQEWVHGVRKVAGIWEGGGGGAAGGISVQCPMSGLLCSVWMQSKICLHRMLAAYHYYKMYSAWKLMH